MLRPTGNSEVLGMKRRDFLKSCGIAVVGLPVLAVDVKVKPPTATEICQRYAEKRVELEHEFYKKLAISSSETFDGLDVRYPQKSDDSIWLLDFEGTPLYKGNQLND